MRWQQLLARVLVQASVPLGILLLVFLVVLFRPAGTSNVVGVKANHVGAFLMLDPQGDPEMARNIVASAQAKGTPQVVLSRKVLGSELPCLGYSGSGSLGSHPGEILGLVVLHGEMEPTFPGPLGLFIVTNRYVSYVYDMQHGEMTAESGPDWPSLRAAFGGPAWPQSSPMYVSPDGQPSLAELEPRFQTPGNLPDKGQDLHVFQEIAGWRVTVAHVHAIGDSVTVDYTVSGPRSQYRVDEALLHLGGKDLKSFSGRSIGDSLGPSVGSITFSGLPESAQPQDLALRFVVPAVHVRSAGYPCAVTAGSPAPYATSTAVPNFPQPGSYKPASVPDVRTVGPFTIDLPVRLEPRPTQPWVPSPIPTPASALPPIPVATGQP